MITAARPVKSMTEDGNNDTRRGLEMSVHEHQASKMPAPMARQAAVTGRVRYVLGIGIGLVVIAFAIIYFQYF